MLKLTPQYIVDCIELTEFSNAYDFDNPYEETRRIEFEPTNTLDNEADRIREEDGFHPLFKGDFDVDGWYCYFATITETAVLNMYFETEYTKEDGGLYYFDVDEETKQLIYYKVISIVGADRWKEIWK